MKHKPSPSRNSHASAHPKSASGGRPANRNARPTSRGESRSGAPTSRAHVPSRSADPASPRPAKGSRGVVGLHAAAEVLKVRPKAITRFVLKSDYESSAAHVDLAKLAEKFGIKVEKQNVGFLDRIALHHQGIFIEVNASPQFDWQALKSAEQSCLIALDGLEDIMNLGAIVRTGWLFEIDGILLPESRSATVTPAVSKVASGGVEHVPIHTVANLINPLKDLKDEGYWVFGLAEEGSQSLWKTKIPDKVIWVTGAEDKGIRSTVKGICDQMIAIPQAASGSSFNASVATAIVLAETRRQWSEK